MTELLIRRLALAPTSLNEQERTVEAVASTGAGVARRDAAGAFEERLDVSAIDPASLHGVPVLNAHRHGSIADTLGVVTAARIEAGKLIVTIKLSQRSDSIVQDIKDGILRGISIGYQVEGWKESLVAGKRIKTATRWTIREVSLVPVPADPGATIRSGADMSDDDQNAGGAGVIERAAVDADIRRICDAAQIERAVADRLIAIGAEAADARRLALDAMRTQPIRVSVGRSDQDPATRAERMGEALATRADPSLQPSEQARPYIGMRVPDMARECLRAAGQSVTGLPDAEVVTRALTTSDYPLFLSNAMHKTLRPAYDRARRPIMSLSREKQANDFRPLRRLQFSGDIRPKQVSEHGEYEYGAFAEAQETYSAKRFGRMAGWSVELQANDDLGFLSQVAPQWAEAWASFEADELLALVISNSGAGPTLADGNPLFHTSHGNVADSGTLIAFDELTPAVLAMRKQRGLSGEIINVRPAIILLGPDREATALAATADFAPTEAEMVNPGRAGSRSWWSPA